MATGWHFYKEGSKKFKDPEFSSAYLFQAAVGPMAQFYRGQIPDRWGDHRLDQERVFADFDRFVDRAKSHYRLDEKQSSAADKLLEAAKNSYNWTLAKSAEEITEFRLELAKYRKVGTEKVNQEVEFARERVAAKETELRGKVTPWLREVTAQYHDLEERLYELATPQQRGSRLQLRDPSYSTLDNMVKYVITGAGALLLLGLFTRLAAGVAATFLLSVMATQPPWIADASTQFFYYQFVEFFALMVLIVFAAGRYAGLDYVIAGLVARRRASQKEGV